MFIRPLSKLHLGIKMALFGIFFIKFFDHMRAYGLKIFRKICAKIAHSSNQSEFRKRSVRLFCFILLLNLTAVDASAGTFDSKSMSQVPILYKGRVRPLEAYARLWLYELMHREAFSSREAKLYNADSALDLLWKLHLIGHQPWDHLPLFWIDSSLRQLLSLPQEKSRYSFLELQQAISFTKEATHTSEKTKKLIELLNDYATYGEGSPEEKTFEEAFEHLAPREDPSEVVHMLAMQFPLKNRLESDGGNLKIIPCKNPTGIWTCPSKLNLPVPFIINGQVRLQPINNFTLYADNSFKEIRKKFDALKESTLNQFNRSSSVLNDSQLRFQAEDFANQLLSSYAVFAGKESLKAEGKGLNYPTLSQLRWEVISYQFPFIELIVTAYSLSLIAFAFFYWKKRKSFYKLGLGLLIAGFCLHTMVILVRCYVLNRPPVTTMLESVIYVPWIALFSSFLLVFFLKARIVMPAALLVATTLLVILHFQLNTGMENVQAVLDSQYWLIVHVLLVAGSYGLFLLGGLIGHLYAIGSIFSPNNPALSTFSKLILQTMYVGCALLIPGTILGGVWAAESWGRFWDWDPKEAWAFISASIYIIWIHAYRFGLISQLGLAIGAIVGMMAVSFTWYGVNYILGTGLHSYGFGSGGEIYYYLYLILEIFFLLFLMLYQKYRCYRMK